MTAQYQKAIDTPGDRTGSMVFPKQIIDSSSRLASLWEKIDVLRDKPILIVWGMKDIAFREKELRQWQHAFPTARTVQLTTVGHFVQEEAPEELAEAVVPFPRGV